MLQCIILAMNNEVFGVWNLRDNGMFYRSTIKDNVELIKLQKQLAEKGNAFIVLEEKFLHLQEVRGSRLHPT